MILAEIVLSSAWRRGEVWPTFSAAAKPRNLRSLQRVTRPDPAPRKAEIQTIAPSGQAATADKVPQRPKLIYARSGNGKFHAIEMVWPLVCRRLEGCPNINSSQLFEELCVQFPGRFNPWQLKTLTKRVKVLRQDARARSVVIAWSTLAKLLRWSVVLRHRTKCIAISRRLTRR